MHEITANIEVHGIAATGVVLAFAQDMVLKSLDTIMGATSFDATVAVLNKCPFKDGVCVIII